MVEAMNSSGSSSRRIQYDANHKWSNRNRSVTISRSFLRPAPSFSPGDGVIVSPHRDEIRPRLPQKQKLPPDRRQWL
jgi:hypothetical protein